MNQRPVHWLFMRFLEEKLGFGLGGARTHNQRLKRAVANDS